MRLEKDLSNYVKHEIVQFLLRHCKDGKPQKGKKMEAASLFKCSTKTMARIWKSAQEQIEEGKVIEVANQRVGRSRKFKHKVNHEAIQQVNYQKRGTIRALAEQIHVPKSIVGRWAKQRLIRAHTNAVKPDLTAPNKLLRLSFSLQAIHFDRQTNVLKFKPMENIIHIDEKWFYLTKKTHKYYMTPLEEDPYKTCKSKKHIPKVMFMCVVCRPIFSEDGAVKFDGKIGMWPFTQVVAAVRNNKKRKAGTMEIKPIESITKEVIKECLINQIVPAVKAKWPSCLSKTIYIQQDHAKPYINNCDPDFQQVAYTAGFHISLVQQPPNSPDLNVNDLGFFRAIQSLQHEQACSNTEELVVGVVNAFNELDPITLNKVFMSLQCCQVEILKVKGTNNYKVPHMKKNALLLQNALPTDLEVEEDLVKECIDYLISEGHTDGIEELISALGLEIPL